MISDMFQVVRYLLQLGLLVPAFGGALLHPSLDSDFQRSWSCCVGPVGVDQTGGLFIKVSPGLATSGRELQDLAMLVNDAAGEMLVDEILDAQVLGAFVEDQISTFEVRRRAYRRALVQGGGERAWKAGSGGKDWEYGID